MKFLTKKPTSSILATNLVYKAGNAKNNDKLKAALLKEQKNFCAYTERYILQDGNSGYPEALDVEHFTAAKKGTAQDDYYNYYAVSHKTNLKKSDKKYADADFHESLFFQNRAELDRRIGFDPQTNTYRTKNKDDKEAEELIDFIGIDSETIANRRLSHLRFLEELKSDLQFSDEQFTNWLFRYPQHLSFITAIEARFGVDLEGRLG